MTPPLRDRECQQALWRGLKFDDLQIVSTDHCPFCFNEKTHGMLKTKQFGKDDFSKILNGAPGVEFRLLLLYDGGVNDGRINLNRFVQLVDGDSWLGRAGMGQYLHRSASGRIL